MKAEIREKVVGAIRPELISGYADGEMRIYLGNRSHIANACADAAIAVVLFEIDAELERRIAVHEKQASFYGPGALIALKSFRKHIRALGEGDGDEG